MVLGKKKLSTAGFLGGLGGCLMAAMPVSAAVSDISGLAAGNPDVRSPMTLTRPVASSAPALIAQSSSLSEADEDRFNELLRQAQERVDDRDYRGAIGYYQQALQIDRDNARLYSGIGYLQLQQGDYQLAVENYRQAIEREPRNLPFRYGLAFSLFQAQQFEEAADVYRELIRM
ncbi:MAG: tetratricopeptide repeat protein, partial [Cyanobacteria bacterium J06627_15]